MWQWIIEETICYPNPYKVGLVWGSTGQWAYPKFFKTITECFEHTAKLGVKRYHIKIVLLPPDQKLGQKRPYSETHITALF